MHLVNISIVSDNTSPLVSSIDLDSVLNISQFSEHDILYQLKRSKYNFTAGIDGIPNCLVKDCAGAFVEPSITLFN